VREYKERNYQFKTNNIMRTKFANLMKPALLIGAVMQRLLIFKNKYYGRFKETDT
jgi:hypothetical protein